MELSDLKKQTKFALIVELFIFRILNAPAATLHCDVFMPQLQVPDPTYCFSKSKQLMAQSYELF